MTAAAAPARIEDLARLAGVSKKTVSRYLNNSPLLSDAMRERLGAVMAETGFVPNAQARALALGRNFLVALVHDGSDRGILGAVEEGMTRALAGGELALVLHETAGEGAAPALRAFLGRHRPAGLVLMPPLSEREDLATLCEDAGVRCVRLGRVRGEHGLACDDRSAAARLCDWMVEQGHRRIGLIGGPEGSLTAQQRELGYLDAMAEHGLDRGPSLIVPGDNTFESGIEAGHLLLEVSPRPTAIIACNDEMAAGVLHAAAQSGVPVPDRLSVVGFDDTPLAARTLPALTSMRVPWQAMGSEAVGRIVSAQPAAPSDIEFEARLVVRDSVMNLSPQRSGASVSAFQSG